MKRYRVYLDSAQWTCYSNFTILSKIYKYLIRNNHLITNNIKEADYIIINSCGHTDISEKNTVNIYNKLNNSKKTNAKILIIGCLVSINKEKLKSFNANLIELDYLDELDDIFYRRCNFKDIPDSCSIELKKNIMEKKILKTYKNHFMFFYPLSTLLSKKIKRNLKYFVDLSDGNNVVFIKIGQGCTGNCSYCAIKSAKGKPKSRSIEDIISDIDEVYHPSKTFYFVADDCGSYGIDIKTTLPDLLFKINENFPNIKIHLQYLEPVWLKNFPKEYFKLFKEVNIKFVTIPLQSGSNKLISLMNRSYDVDEIIEVINRIRKISLKTTLSTYFIVGFHGETIHDFLLSIKTSKYFDISFLMPFSERKGTECVKFNKKKSKFNIMLRYCVALLLTKILFLIKLMKYEYTDTE